MRGAATKPLLATVIVLAAHSLAFGQAGSVGGVIGKTDKSVSGGAAPTEPQTEPSRTRSRQRVDKGNSDQSASASVSGWWHWTAQCPSGNWQGEFNLAESSRGNFSGSFTGTWLSGGKISDGNVDGSSIGFTRTVAFVTQHWIGHLAAGSMKGTLGGNEDCNWDATKK